MSRVILGDQGTDSEGREKSKQAGKVNSTKKIREGKYFSWSYFPTGGGGGGGLLPYMRYIGMCGPKGYGFPAVLIINRVLIFALYS